MRRIAGAAVLAAIILLPACGGSTGGLAPGEKSKTVGKSNFPGWPLTVDSGSLRCAGSGSLVNVTIVVDGKRYGVNGSARADKKNLDLFSIWANGTKAGVKKNIGPLVNEGLKLCK